MARIQSRVIVTVIVIGRMQKKIENDVMELCLLIYIIYILDIGYAWL